MLTGLRTVELRMGNGVRSILPKKIWEVPPTRMKNEEGAYRPSVRSGNPVSANPQRTDWKIQIHLCRKK